MGVEEVEKVHDLDELDLDDFFSETDTGPSPVPNDPLGLDETEVAQTLQLKTEPEMPPTASARRLRVQSRSSSNVPKTIRETTAEVKRTPQSEEQQAEAKERKKETAAMAQYNKFKKMYPDFLLMFMLGDFYEMFHEDAEKASQILDITVSCNF